jgi:hypothetical protein
VKETDQWHDAEQDGSARKCKTKERRKCWKEVGKEQEVLGRTNRLLSLILHGPHWKRRVQQFCCCLCIRYRGNVFTEPLLRNNRGIFTEPLPRKD